MGEESGGDGLGGEFGAGPVEAEDGVACWRTRVVDEDLVFAFVEGDGLRGFVTPVVAGEGEDFFAVDGEFDRAAAGEGEGEVVAEFEFEVAGEGGGEGAGGVKVEAGVLAGT
jgi:hypothetical protein